MVYCPADLQGANGWIELQVEMTVKRTIGFLAVWVLSFALICVSGCCVGGLQEVNGWIEFWVEAMAERAIAPVAVWVLSLWVLSLWVLSLWVLSFALIWVSGCCLDGLQGVNGWAGPWLD